MMGSIENLETALALLASLDPKRIPLHHAQVIVFLCKQDGWCTYRTIEQRFDLTNASVSRILNSFKDQSPHRKNCLGILETRQDPNEGRRQVVRLNDRGRAFAKALDGLTENRDERLPVKK